MKNIKKSILMVIIGILITSLVACGSTGSDSDGKSHTQRSIGTGGSGGVFYILGAGIGNIVSSNSDYISLTAQSTAASAENMNLTDSAELDFSFSVYDAAIDAYNGAGNYTREYENLRLVLGGHGGYQHVIVRENSDIQTIEDLKGKKIGIPPGDIGEKIVIATLKPYGLTMDDVEVIPLSFNEMANGLKDDTLDVATIFAGTPASAIMELQSSIDVRFINQTDEGLAKLVEDNPYWFTATIPGEAYNLDNDIKTFLAPYIILANKDVPDEVVYDFIKIVFENNADLLSVHPEAKHFTGENEFYKKDALFPYHPGAEKYLKENGFIN